MGIGFYIEKGGKESYLGNLREFRDIFNIHDCYGRKGVTKEHLEQILPYVVNYGDDDLTEMLSDGHFTCKACGNPQIFIKCKHCGTIRSFVATKTNGLWVSWG